MKCIFGLVLFSFLLFGCNTTKRVAPAPFIYWYGDTNLIVREIKPGYYFKIDTSWGAKPIPNDTIFLRRDTSLFWKSWDNRDILYIIGLDDSGNIVEDTAHYSWLWPDRDSVASFKQDIKIGSHGWGKTYYDSLADQYKKRGSPWVDSVKGWYYDSVSMSGIYAEDTAHIGRWVSPVTVDAISDRHIIIDITLVSLTAFLLGFATRSFIYEFKKPKHDENHFNSLD